MHKQSKVVLGVILILSITLAIILVKGNNQTPSLNIIDNKISQPIEKLSVANLQSTQPAITQELSEETSVITENGGPVIEFKNVEYSMTNNGFYFNGTLYSNNTAVDGLTVKLFCNNKEAVNTLINRNDVTLSDKDGNFEIMSYCEPNEEAYAQIQYDNITFESTHVIIPHGRFSHSAVSVTSSPTGVPEYSTLTIGLAVIAVLFGLVFLRKR